MRPEPLGSDPSIPRSNGHASPGEDEVFEDLHRSRAELAEVMDVLRPEPREASAGSFPRSRIMRQIVSHPVPAGAVVAGVLFLALKPRLGMTLLRRLPLGAVAASLVSSGSLPPALASLLGNVGGRTSGRWW